MFYILAIVLLIFFLSAAIKVLREYERGVVFRLGRVINTKGPGIIIIIPIVDKLVKVNHSLRKTNQGNRWVERIYLPRQTCSLHFFMFVAQLFHHPQLSRRLRIKT